MIEAAPIDREVVLLREGRPRNRFARVSVILFALIIVASWLSADLSLGELVSSRRAANLERFLGDIRPYPLQGEPWSWSAARGWAAEVMREKGFEGALSTLAISIVAIVLAGAGGFAFSFLAARTVATPEPWLPLGRAPSRLHGLAWSTLVALARTALIFLRAIPEYVWAFLLIATIGPTAWPAILALALHNLGILGKLNAEVVENLPPASLAAMRGAGAGRLQVAVFGAIPAVTPRFLLFFFYRWETCVREATVLGMLGVISLGWFIQDARARTNYDEMFLLILAGSAIVLVGDLMSALAREAVRRAR